MLRRISPGKYNTLSLVRTAGGSLKSDPKEQAEALAAHCASAFAAKPVAGDKIRRWLDECPPGPKIAAVSPPGRTP